MEAEQNFKKEYDEILAIYSKRKGENAVIAKNIPQLQNNIANLQQQLSKYASQVSEDTSEGDRIEIAALTSQSHEQQQLIKSLETDIKNGAIEFSQQVQQLRIEHNHHLEHLKASHGPQPKDLQKINHQISSVQRSVNEETHLISSLKSEYQSEEALLAELQAEVARLHEAERHLNSQPHANQNSALDSQLAELEKSLAVIQNEFQVEKNQRDSEKVRLEALVNADKAKFLHEHSNVKTKQAQNQTLQKQLSSNENEKLNQLQAEIKRLDNKNAEIQKEIDTLAQIVEKKKAEKAAKQQEHKKYKEKKERNYKVETNEAEKTQENLKKQMDREKQKLSDVLKLSKTYVSQQNLQILQKQLTRHQAASSKINVETEDSKKNKHLKENEVLKSRIQNLRSSVKNLEEQTESNVKELRKAGDELVKQKLAQEKVFNQTTNKLNEYMKEFPDHEKKKEQQKLEEKKRKAEEKERIREAAREEKDKKKQQEKAKAAEKAALQSEQNPNLPKWEQWEDKKLPVKDNSSIFNNRQFQVAGGAIALLAILFLTLR